MKVGRLIVCATLVVGCALTVSANATDRIDLKGRETNAVLDEARGAWVNTIQLGQSGLTATQMCNVLLGAAPPGLVSPPGVTVVGTFAGVPRAGGIFSDADPRRDTGLSHGAIISSGHINTAEDNAPFWNMLDFTTWINAQPGDADVSAITGRVTFDRAALTCSVTSTQWRWLVFWHVFGSEEYDEWVNSRYNDGFGIWVGPTGFPALRRNVAVMPGWWPWWRPWWPWPWWPGWWWWWWTPVTVNTVNLGGLGWNAWHYISNDCTFTIGAGHGCNGTRRTELDGLVQWYGRIGMWPFFYGGPPGPSTWPAYPIRSRPYLLIPDTPYDVKFAIADASDFVLDSVAMARGYPIRGFCWLCPLGDRQEASCSYEYDDQTTCETEGGIWYEDPIPDDDVPFLCTDIVPPCGDVGACNMVVLGESEDPPVDPPVSTDFVCTETIAEVCWESNGVFGGVGSSCADPVGSCCLETGMCVETSEGMCTTLDGTFTLGGTCDVYGSCILADDSCMTTTVDCCTGAWLGPGTECPVEGACCTNAGCEAGTPDTCTGTFMGVGTVCTDQSCDQHHEIPTVTEWGVAVMTLLLLSAATVVLMRRRAAMV